MDKVRLVVYTLIIMLFTIGLVNSASAVEYPDFLEDGDSLEAAIVVGELGSAHDFQSASVILSDLLVRGNGYVSTPAAAGGNNYGPLHYMIKNNYDFLEGGETLSKVRTFVTENEFAALSSDEVIDSRGEFPYEQFLFLGTDTAVAHAVADAVPDDPTEMPSAYLRVRADNGAAAYEYKLFFDEPVESSVDEDESFDLGDLDGTEIQILGNDYTILRVEHPAQDHFTITLLGNSLRDSLREGETKVYDMDGVDYEITPVIISGDQDVKFVINGESIKKMQQGDIKRFDDGVMIYVRDVLVNEREGIVDFSLGHGEIVLDDTNVSDGAYDGLRWEVGNEDVDDTNVWIEGFDPGLVDGGIAKISAIGLKWVPDETHYVGVGQGLLDILEDKEAIFGQNFDITYDGGKSFSIEGPNQGVVVEALQLKPKGDQEYILMFTNKLGQVLELPLFYDNSGTFSRFGDDENELHLQENRSIDVNDYFVVTSDGYALPPDAVGNTRFFKYEGQDVSENILQFTDMPTGESIEVHYADGATVGYLRIDGQQYRVEFTDVANDGAIEVDLDNDGSIDTGESPTLVTVYNMDIHVETEGTFAYKRFYTHSNVKSEALLAGHPSADANVIFNSAANTIIAALSGAGAPVSNVVLDTNPVQEIHDVVEFTVLDDSGEIDLNATRRCLDGGDRVAVTAAINTSYDTNTTVRAILAGAGYSPELSTAIPQAFYEGCDLGHSFGALQFMLDLGDTDDTQGTTAYGQKVIVRDDDNGPDTILFFSPKVQVEHPIVLHALRLVEEDVEPVEDIPAAVKTEVQTFIDNEYTDLGIDMILVGGPCSNMKTREVMGVRADQCAAGYEDGKGRITLLEYNGLDVLVISGYSGQDTLMAAKALVSLQSFEGNDLMVSGTMDEPIVEPYVAPAGAPKVPVAPVEEKAAPIQEEAAPIEYHCDETNDEAGTYNLEISKLGIKKELISSPRVEMNGVKGKVIYDVSEKFVAQLGVDWMQYVVHIHKGDCNGKEITSLTFKWEDGDGDKQQSFTVPEEGCYCMKVSDADVTIDDADIEMTSNDGVFELPFSTKSQEDGNLLTGNVIFDFQWFPSRPLNDMNIWE